MHVTLLLALLAASPIRLAAPKSQVSNIDAKTGDALAGQLAQQLALQPGITVTTPEEMAALLGLDRQKSLLGCAESCTAELVGALGVDGVVISTISKLGASYVVNVKIVGASSAQQLAVASHRVQTLDALVDALSATASELAAEVRAQLRPGEVTSVPAAKPEAVRVESQPSPRRGWLIPVAVGVALMAVGGASYGVSKFEEARIRAGDPADVDATISAGRTEQVAGFVLLGIGAAAVVGGVLWGVLGGSSASAQPAVMLAPGPGGFSVLVRWP